MNCKQCQKQLSAFNDRELPPDIHKRVAGHLAECEKCRTESEQMIATWDLLSLPIPDPKPYAYARLKNRMVQPEPSRGFYWPEIVLVPVLTVMMLMAGVWFGSQAAKPVDSVAIQDDIPESSAMETLEELNKGSLSDAYADLIAPVTATTGGER